MNFYDTSVFVAGFLDSHPSHHSCARRIANLTKDDSASSTHTLSEVYATLSGLPRPQKLTPTHAVAAARIIAARVKCVTLTADEHIEILQSAAARGLSGGIIYDALLMGCARKSGAKRIYTLNPSHFQLAAPDLASLVRVP